MDDSKFTQNIMIFLKKKYNNLEQILNYTNDILESMGQNDLDTVNILFDSRASLMNETDIFDEEISKTISLISDESRLRISCLLSGASINSEVSFEESKIKELYTLNKVILSKIIELDKALETQISAKTRLLSIENA